METTGELTHWAPVQYLYLLMHLFLAEALNMPASKIRVINPAGVGGGFTSH